MRYFEYLFVKKIKVQISGLLIFCLIVLTAAGLVNKSASADTVTDDFASGKLVIKTSDSTLIPDGGAICDYSEDTFLVDYETPQAAREAFYEAEASQEMIVSPETSFLISSDSSDFAREIPKETGKALSNCLQNEFPDFENEDVIALIDTGAGDNVYGRFSVLGDDGEDRNGHGKKMVRAMQGVFPEAKIVSIKAITDKGVGSVSSVYAGILAAIEMRAKVINLSVVAKSVEENEVINSVVRRALDENIIVVGAAGNNSDDAAGYIPASISGVITVGACDERGRRLETSNFGDCVNWNLVAGTTSEACAKLSAFIAKNCEPDENLSSIILSHVGNGLIFTTTYEEKKKEMEEIADDWKEINVATMSDEQKNAFLGGGDAFISGLRISPEQKIAILETSKSVLSTTGDFVPADSAASWAYATLTVQNKVRLSDMSTQDIQAMITRPVDNVDQKYEFTNKLSASRDHSVISIKIGYTPGSIEKDYYSAIGGNAPKASDIKYQLTYRYNSGPYAGDSQTGWIPVPANDDYVTNYKVWMDSSSAMKYLYEMNLWHYGANLSTPSSLVRSGRSSDIEAVMYREGDVGTAERATFGTLLTRLTRIDAALSLRRYELYFQKGSDESTRQVACQGRVGGVVNIEAYKNRFAKSFYPGKKVIWNYSMIPVAPDKDGNMKMIPSRNLQKFTDNGDTVYKFVISGTPVEDKGRAEITITSGETGVPISGLEFKMTGTAGIPGVERTGLVTNSAGKIILENLLWEYSDDVGTYDGKYVIEAVKVPEGFEDIRPIVIDINEGNVKTTQTASRVLEMKMARISFNTVSEVPNTKDGVFMYKIAGTTVGGTKREYILPCVEDEAEIFIEAGNYTITPMVPLGYVLKEITHSPCVSYEEGMDSINLNVSKGFETWLRLVWERIGNYDNYGGVMKINSFKR